MNAEAIMQKIEALELRGAYQNAHRALDALVMLTYELQGAPSERLEGMLVGAASRMEKANPSWSIVGTACQFAIQALTESDRRSRGLFSIQAEVRARAEIFQDGMKKAQEDVALAGANLLSDGSTIVLISYSGTIVGILAKAWESGKRISVIGTESRPNLEGHEMAAALVNKGIPYTLITDAALTHFVEDADLALVGVDTLLASGAVVNKIGTMPLALACQHFGKPLYAATSSYKMSVRSLQGHGVELKVVDDPAGIAPKSLLESPNLHVRNLFFELTPARFFEGIITEYGIHHPAEARTLWERSRDQLEGRLCGIESSR